MAGSAKQKASCGIGKLHGSKIYIQFTLIFLESFRMFQSRERVDPSAVPLLEKPNPVSKINFHFANVILIMHDDSAFAVVKIT